MVFADWLRRVSFVEREAEIDVEFPVGIVDLQAQYSTATIGSTMITKTTVIAHLCQIF